MARFRAAMTRKRLPSLGAFVLAFAGAWSSGCSSSRSGRSCADETPGCSGGASVTSGAPVGSASGAGSGNAGSGNAGRGNAGSGNAGSGNAGSGNAGSGNAGSGNAGRGGEGTGAGGRAGGIAGRAGGVAGTGPGGRGAGLAGMSGSSGAAGTAGSAGAAGGAGSAENAGAAGAGPFQSPCFVQGEFASCVEACSSIGATCLPESCSYSTWEGWPADALDDCESGMPGTRASAGTCDQTLPWGEVTSAIKRCCCH
jgi:hypothetical protein